jgi:prepilin-type N-terminal cleavage/methylation domain-containing protein
MIDKPAYRSHSCTAAEQTAFTLVEMLVVISIMAILAALTLSAIKAVQQSNKRSKTQAIMQAVQQGLRLGSAEYGGSLAPAEHPLAGSREPRPAFVRGDLPHASVSTTGVAYRGVLLTNLAASDQGNLMLPDDRFADASVPMLYGATRRELTVLAPNYSWVTYYRQLPFQPTYATVVANPATVGVIIDPNGQAGEGKELFAAIFSKGGTLEALNRLDGLYTPPDDDAANLIVNDRVWSATTAGVKVSSTTRVTVGGVEHTYRLRGSAIYDAWGNEIFYRVSGDGSTLTFTSAGRDGVLRFSPGGNGTFESDPWADAAAGDDRLGSDDNIVIGEER